MYKSCHLFPHGESNEIPGCFLKRNIVSAWVHVSICAIEWVLVLSHLCTYLTFWNYSYHSSTSHTIILATYLTLPLGFYGSHQVPGDLGGWPGSGTWQSGGTLQVVHIKRQPKNSILAILLNVLYGVFDMFIMVVSIIIYQQIEIGPAYNTILTNILETSRHGKLRRKFLHRQDY